ncbi:monovalent cation:proton antiporter-2 (CPA2) family protein [Anderseniella sp. Alg231-50]|uniref:monovalent cation:proton antiporter-2 (CPA2) family protein n=1 Tax=Anderseniella sp. Alg231-50 TaxID=1922226 RepID=UPI003FCDDBEA
MTLGNISLFQIAILLASAALIAPLAKYFRIGAVLGYLFAGVIIGPFVLRIFTDAEKMLHVAEFGVVLLLFLIGLELRPQRLFAMRKSVIGAGGTQVLVSALILFAMMLAAQYNWRIALFTGLALALSSTAMVLQVLKEQGELEHRHGRLGFAVLLFQDIAAIPMIAFVGLLAVSGGEQATMTWYGATKALGAICLVILAGRYVLGFVFHLIAKTGVSEAMTAFALLTIVVIEIIMKSAGLSPALGAFIAGALLADSAYRHEIEADIKPFESLLLGMFFVAVGMSLDLRLITEIPGTIILAATILMVTKGIILFFTGRYFGLNVKSARRFSVALAQGGEFAFVLTTTALAAFVITRDFASKVNVVVTLTMVATPLLMLAEGWLSARAAPAADTDDKHDDMPDQGGHVVIAGLGRFGQIIARVLAARKIPFTALDGDPTQIEIVRKFGGKVYFGDASRQDILDAAQVSKARAFVVCVSNPQASLKIVELVRKKYPDLPIYVRARDRNHVHQLMDHGVEHIMRETFLSAVEMSRRVLLEAGLGREEAARTIKAFANGDRARLYDDYQHYSDVQKMAESAKRHAQELSDLFTTDADAGLAEDQPNNDKPRRRSRQAR